jgi:hypothetical protein
LDDETSLARLATKMLAGAQGNIDAEAKLSRPMRFLVWGGSHPMWFSLLVAVACLVPSLLFLPAYKAEWIIFQFPKLPDDYTHASYFGTIWTIQATLIALVYPIVLTFVPILLSRRAASKFALSFYLRNSVVLPAGLSSLSLLVVMTVLYLFAYYIPNTLFLFGVGLTGLWLFANLVLTGTFLVRTLQYVEEQVGEEMYVSHSLHYVLWDDLHNSLVTWLYKDRAAFIGDPSWTSVSVRSAHLEIRPRQRMLFST